MGSTKGRRERLGEKLARLEQRESLIGKGSVVVELDGAFLTIRRGVFDKTTHQIDESVAASVETAGNITTRPTVTRTAAGVVIAGPVGALLGLSARKKVDKRELYLLVEGADWAEVVELKPKQGAQARKLAQRINVLSRDRGLLDR